MAIGQIVLEARSLFRFFHAGEEEVAALKNVSLELRSGQMVAVYGPSGSGKSTLLHCLAGLDEPTAGSVAVLGQRITRQTERDRARSRAQNIGILLQSGNLFPHLTVWENLRIPLKVSRSQRGRPRSELLESLRVDHLKNHYPRHLSGGELARVGLAVALVTSPAVLLADEPTGELDRDSESVVLELIGDFKKSGGAVLVVTHSAVLVEASDRQILLYDGVVANA